MSSRSKGSTRAVIHEWWWLLVFLCSLSSLTLQQGWLDRLNASFYDTAISLYQRDIAEDIVIVAIDENSLAEVGRWPWKRDIYAKLLGRLTDAKVKVVGLDLILSEADTEHPDDDALLGAAIKRNGHVVLPVFAEPLHGVLTETQPIEVLGRSAAALGHIQSNLDVDGVARHLFLRCGTGHPHHPQFALAMLQVAEHKPSLHESPLASSKHNVESTAWYCAEPYNIPFAGPPGSVRLISASALLRGEVPAQQLRDKLVLVGATAVGLGDSYPTPVSGESYAMPGVEINAQLIDALRRGLVIGQASTISKWLYGVLPVALLMLAFLFLLPRRALLSTAGVVVSVLAVSAFSLRWPGFWLPPAESLLVLMLCYPLWSWRKLEAGMRYLSEEVAELDRESAQFSSLTPAVHSPVSQHWIVDPVAARIEQVRHASREVRLLRTLVDQTVISQSVGVLVVDADMHMRLANPTLAHLLGVSEPSQLHKQTVDQLFEKLACPLAADWGKLLLDVAHGQVVQCETRNDAGRDFLVSVIGVENFGWIINLDDISALKAHERERARLLNFLSHDMRAPQASILALLNQHAHEPVAEDHLLPEIRRHSERTLHLVSQFMYLARAENLHNDDFVMFDIVQCMHDAIDEVWPQAKACGVSIKRPATDASLSVFGDPTLLRRAFINLITNAVQHSPSDAKVTCNVHWLAGEVCCSVQDNGEGISAEDQALLFQTFSRLSHSKNDAGTGLGLALVKMVTEKHGGRVAVQSAPGQGSIFFMYFEMATDIHKRQS